MKTDPIFALIEAHKIKEAAWLAVVDHEDDDFPTPAAEKAHRRNYDRTHKAKSDALRALSNTKPTTIEGFAALFAHLLPMMNEVVEGHYTDGCIDNLFKTMSATAHGFVPPARPARGQVINLKKAA